MMGSWEKLGECCTGGKRTLRAAVDEHGAILDEVPWDIEDFLELVGHGGYILYDSFPSFTRYRNDSSL
jgi:hypothetical protein